jgi:hypothetical protein
MLSQAGSSPLGLSMFHTPSPARRAHPAGFSMAFCDSSVRHIPFNIDVNVHQALLVRDDGKIGN